MAFAWRQLCRAYRAEYPARSQRGHGGPFFGAFLVAVLSLAAPLRAQTLTLTNASVGAQLKVNYNATFNSNYAYLSYDYENNSYWWGQTGVSYINFVAGGGNWGSGTALGTVNTNGVTPATGTWTYPTYLTSGSYGFYAYSYYDNWSNGYYDGDDNWVDSYDNYYQITSQYISINLVVGTTPQTISLTNPGTKAYGSGAFTLAATASSGLTPVTFTATGPVTLSGTNNATCTPWYTGSVTITASQAGNGTYAPATATQTFTVSKANQTVTFPSIATRSWTNRNLNLTGLASASTGYAVTYSVVSGNATISGSVLYPQGNIGQTITLRATQAGNVLYNAASADQTYTVLAATTTEMQYNNLLNLTDGSLGTNLVINYAAGFAWYSSNSSTDYNNSTYYYGDKGPYYIEFRTNGGNWPAVGYSATGAVVGGVYCSPATGYATGTWTRSGMPNGTYGVTAYVYYDDWSDGYYDGDDNWVDSYDNWNNYNNSSISITIAVGTTPQTISFTNPGTKVFGGGAFALVATASSGLTPVTFTATGSVTLSGTNNATCTPYAPGSVTITASQVGNGTYAPATATQTFTVNKADQTVTFPSIATRSWSNRNLTLIGLASTSTGLAVTYSVVSGNAVITGSVLYPQGNIGQTITLRATQVGNTYYNAASADQTYTVLAATTTEMQYNNLLNLTDASLGTNLTINYAAGFAWCSSGSSTDYENNNYNYGDRGPYYIEFRTNGGNWPAVGLNATGAVAGGTYCSPTTGYATGTWTRGGMPNGTYGVTAYVYYDDWSDGYYDGDDNWVNSYDNWNTYNNSSISITITIGTTPQTITFTNPGTKVYGCSAFALVATASSGLTPVTFTATGPVSLSGTNNATCTPYAPGSVTITASQAGNATYAPATATQTFTVNKADQTVTFPAIPNHSWNNKVINLSGLAYASSGYGVTYSILSGDATLSGTVLTPNGYGGTFTIRATQPGNAYYNPAYSDQTYTVIPPTSGEIQSNNLLWLTNASVGTQLKVNYAVGFGSNFSGYSYDYYNNTYSHGYAGCASITVYTYGGNWSSLGYNQYWQIIDTIYPGAHGYDTGSWIRNNTPAGTYGLYFYANYLDWSDGYYDGDGNWVDSYNNYNCYTTSALTVTIVPLTPQTITFNSLSNQTYGAAPFTVAATASSGLTVTFSILTGPATISGNTVTITGAGTVTVRASQAGDTTYAAAPNVDQSFTVAPAAATLAFAPTTFTYNGSAQSPTITPSPVGATYSTTGTATATNAGSYSFTATASGNWTSTPTVCNWSIAPKVVTFAFGNLSVSYDGTGKTPTITPSDPSTTYSTSFSGTAGTTYGPSATPPSAVGSYTVTVTATGNFSGSGAATMTIGMANQTITFGALANHTYGDAPFSVSATASSGLAVTFIIVSGPATISGNTVTITGTGTVIVRASQPGNANYFAATPVDQSFAVSLAPQIITFGDLTKVFGDLPFALSATSNAGGTPTYSIVSQAPNDSTGTGMIALAGATVTISKAGSAQIRADFAGTANYSATSKTITLTVNRAGQTITFTNPGNGWVGDALPLVASATSGLPVSFSVVSGAATIAGTTANLTGLGTVVVRASQPGNSNYSAAPTVDQTITVSQAPVFTSASAVAGTINLPFSFTVSSSGPPTPTFSATGLPAWATLNSSTGVISGTPSAAGVSTVTVTANNGRAVSQTLTITINNYRLIVNAGAGGTATGGGYFAPNSPAPINSVPNNSFQFAGWAGSGIANPQAASTTVMVTSDGQTVTANFTPTGSAPSSGTITFPDAIAQDQGGGTTSTKTMTIANQGNSSLAVSVLATTGDFSPAVSLPVTIGAGSSTDVVVTFAPATLGVRTGKLVLVNNDSTNTPIIYDLVGNGITHTVIPSPTVSGTLLNVGSIFAGDTLSFTVTGTSYDNTLTLVAAKVLAPDGSVAGPVTYTPGSQSAAITRNFSVPLTGGTGTYTVQGYAQDFKSANSGWVVVFTVTVSSGNYQGTISSFAVPAPGLEIWFTPSPVSSATFTIQKSH